MTRTAFLPRKACLSLAFIALCLQSSAFADTPDVVFFPSVFTVGDRVELRVERQDPGPDTFVSVRERDEFPDIESLEIVETTRTRKNGRSLDVCVFIPWVPGDIPVRGFSVKGIPFPSVTVKVASVLSGTDRESRPARPPRALRGTAAVLGTVAVSVVLCGGVFALWFAWFMPAFAKRRALRLARRPASAFLRSLKRLERRSDSAACAEFYRVLSRTSLDFLDSVFPVPVSGLTATEFLASAAGFAETVPSAPGYAEILHRADTARFARRDVDRETMKSDLLFLIERAVEALDSISGKSVPGTAPQRDREENGGTSC